MSSILCPDFLCFLPWSHKGIFFIQFPAYLVLVWIFYIYEKIFLIHVFTYLVLVQIFFSMIRNHVVFKQKCMA